MHCDFIVNTFAGVIFPIDKVVAVLALIVVGEVGQGNLELSEGMVHQWLDPDISNINFNAQQKMK